MKFLHIYGQRNEHDDVWIVGDKEGLTALRDLLNTIIDDVERNSSEFITADHECYKILAVRSDEATLDAKEVCLPYSSNVYKGKHPIILVGPEVYRSLVKP
jgi:hypothetical protein